MPTTDYYRERARLCRELAEVTLGAVSRHLIRMARYYDNHADGHPVPAATPAARRQIADTSRIRD